jgi:hypothetical protein
VFANVGHHHPSLIFAGKASKPTFKALALPANIRLGWKYLTVTNTLAYYGTELITTIKSFKVQALREELCRNRTIKHYGFIIYEIS